MLFSRGLESARCASHCCYKRFPPQPSLSFIPSPSKSRLPRQFYLPLIAYPSHISLLNILFSSPRPPFLDPFFSHLSVFSHLHLPVFPSPSPFFHSLFSLHLHHLSRRPFSSRPTPL
uniref:Uncharacterized protein n=1 Tax=Cacopsylla melanoneura TaxID=428564 RepID=A0A8D8ZB00_9HEMI